eukprot:COSAG02_NODE_1209_length_13869_cov_5.683660_9_plen_48_part_00
MEIWESITTRTPPGASSSRRLKSIRIVNKQKAIVRMFRLAPQFVATA